MAPDDERALAGRVAIVTGASRGIGRGVAAALAAQGVAVTLAARTVEPHGSGLPGSLHEVVDEIRSAGGAALAVRCDVADPADVERLVGRSRDEFGPADILVNNAALTVPDRVAARAGSPSSPSGELRSRMSILNFPVSAYRRAFEVNLFGAYELSRLVLRDMVPLGRGNIVNISSDAAEVPPEGPYESTPGIPLHGYGNSKAALQHLTRTTAYEMADARHQRQCRPALAPGRDAGRCVRLRKPARHHAAHGPLRGGGPAPLHGCAVRAHRSGAVQRGRARAPSAATGVAR